MRIRPKLTYANVMATLAMFVALGGTSFAAVKITGRSIKDGTVSSKDIKNNDVRSRDVRNGSLLSKDFKGGQLPSGPVGPRGAAGPRGATGPQGPRGPQGVAGRNGTNGINGTNGTNGTNGRDGATVVMRARGSGDQRGNPGGAVSYPISNNTWVQEGHESDSILVQVTFFEPTDSCGGVRLRVFLDDASIGTLDPGDFRPGSNTQTLGPIYVFERDSTSSQTRTLRISQSEGEVHPGCTHQTINAVKANAFAYR